MIDRTRVVDRELVFIIASLKASSTDGLTVGSTSIITGERGSGSCGPWRDVGGTVGLSVGSGYYYVSFNDIKQPTNYSIHLYYFLLLFLSLSIIYFSHYFLYFVVLLLSIDGFRVI